MFSNRWFWTILLLALAVIVMLVERGLLGGLIGSFFIIIALTLWIVPGTAFRSDSSHDPTVNRVSRTAFGVGLGLLAAAAAALLLPPQYFSWLVIGVGLLLIVWFVLELRR